MLEEMEIYDAHVHYLWRDSLAENRSKFMALQEKGLQGMALIVMGYHLADPQKCFEFIPHAYHDKIGQHIFSESSGMELPAADQFSNIEIFPYLDSRYITETEADLSRFKEKGFRGLKLLYVADEDKAYGMTGWTGLFGKSHQEYEKLTLHLIEQAVAFNWPVIFHADLRLHEGFIQGVLERFSGHSFIFPHFGFSRKIMARLIEQYTGCYTDFSSLLPFMQKNPERYREFIETYADRVLFGSDATSDWPDLISAYIETVKALIADDVIRKKVFRDNYLKVHQVRDHGAGDPGRAGC
ncbi:amidohydrolase family protein [bacterium]|nr:amidohydrolase family protein [bacterium]